MNAHTVATARESLVQHLRSAILMTVVLTVLLGIVYPLVMTGISQVLFFQSDEACEVSYADKKGKYQKQQGLTLPRL